MQRGEQREVRKGDTEDEEGKRIRDRNRESKVGERREKKKEEAQRGCRGVKGFKGDNEMKLGGEKRAG